MKRDQKKNPWKRTSLTVIFYLSSVSKKKLLRGFSMNICLKTINQINPLILLRWWYNIFTILLKFTNKNAQHKIEYYLARKNSTSKSSKNYINKRTLGFSLLYKHGNQGRKKWNKLEKNEIKTFNSSFSRDIFIIAENRDDGLNRLKIVFFLFSCLICFLIKRLLLLYKNTLKHKTHCIQKHAALY